MTDVSQPNSDAPNGEFDLIRRIAEVGAGSRTSAADSVQLGIGDDGAIVASPANNSILTTDAIVEGVHFRSTDERWYDIGWKCAVSNLSDIAAMGGTPDHALVTLGVPKGASPETFEELYSGLNAAFDSFGGTIVGGDVVSSPTMFVNLALTGHTSSDSSGNSSWLSRDSAQVGDLVYTTGALGSSAGGLEVLLAGDTNPSGQILVDRHFRPTPRLDIGSALVANDVRCAMDVSDGLVGDLEKIAEQSGVNISLDMLAIPLAPELIFMFGTSAIELALSGGEDYELVFTSPKNIVESMPTEVVDSITQIGEVTSAAIGKGQVTVYDKNGDVYEPIRTGWDHLNG